MSHSCSIEGCPGQYEARKVTHTVRHQGALLVIDEVPAEVCSVCGDVLLPPETIRGIEAMLEQRPAQTSSAPVYTYRQAS